MVKQYLKMVKNGKKKWWKNRKNIVKKKCLKNGQKIGKKLWKLFKKN